MFVRWGHASAPARCSSRARGGVGDSFAGLVILELNIASSGASSHPSLQEEGEFLVTPHDAGC